MSNNQKVTLSGEVTSECDMQRLDVAAAKVFDQYSRARIQQWIKKGDLTVDGKVMKSKEKVLEGQLLSVDTEIEPVLDEQKAEPMALDIVFEDDSILVLNKPAGLVVHPGAGNASKTLMNGLLHYLPSQAQLPRAGIVHRLDKDTTGLMVVAKTIEAHHSLINQLQERTVSRQYYALVQGVITAGGTIDLPIGRHSTSRLKQAVNEFGGKEAITHYRVVNKFRAHTLVRCQLETGRTHQIRVHMAAKHFPLIGDKTYGGRPKLPKSASAEFIEALQGFDRQALHAFKLGLQHPEDGEYHEWEVPMADDLSELVQACRDDMKLFQAD